MVTTDALNYRTGPALDAAVIAVFFTGKQGAITDGPVYADGYTWRQFSTAGTARTARRRVGSPVSSWNRIGWSQTPRE